MKYKILATNENCVLLLNKQIGSYKIYDTEGDVICMTMDREEAERVFNTYDLTKVREEKESNFLEWLRNNAEA